MGQKSAVGCASFNCFYPHDESHYPYCGIFLNVLDKHTIYCRLKHSGEAFTHRKR